MLAEAEVVGAAALIAFVVTVVTAHVLDMPLPPMVKCTPRRPSERLTPDLLKLRRTPGKSPTRRLNRSPIGCLLVNAFDLPDDARSKRYDVPRGAAFITNPPWSRDVLHPIISNLASQAPTWLLLDADWVHTQQSIPFLPRLRMIVSVGRVRWIKDSPFDGKDNAAWHLFGRPIAAPTIFVGRTAKHALEAPRLTAAE
jgi:hypothetical protein